MKFIDCSEHDFTGSGSGCCGSKTVVPGRPDSLSQISMDNASLLSPEPHLIGVDTRCTGGKMANDGLPGQYPEAAVESNTD
jgi:hypothetical protein